MVKRQFPGLGPTPAINGTVSAKGAAVAAAIDRGIFDSQGRQVYVSFAPGSGYVDRQTTYSNLTGKYAIGASGIGLQYVNLFLK